jgi:hypothetical protein
MRTTRLTEQEKEFLISNFIEFKKINQKLKEAKKNKDFLEIKRLNKIKRNLSFQKLAKKLNLSRYYIYLLFEKYENKKNI